MFGLGSIRVGRIFDIDIEVHASWLIIFALVFINFSTFIFPGQRVDFAGGSSAGAAPEIVDFVGGLFATLLFFGSVLAHELAHSLVGRRYGVDIKKITLFIFGGLAQMSGEASDARSEFLMAAAGPGTSLLLATAFWAAGRALELVGAGPAALVPFFELALINLVLAVFNLVPGFPLDGGRLFRAILWNALHDMDRATRIATRAGQAFAAVLITLGAASLLFGADKLGGFWLILIGFFLWSAATSSYQQVGIGEALSGVTVAQIMTRQVVTAPAHVSLADLVSDYFLRYRHGRFPVVEGGHIVGTVTLNDVREVPQREWGSTITREAAKPLTKDDFIEADRPALAALMTMAQSDKGQLLVRDRTGVVGIVTKSDILQAIRIRSELDGRG